MLKRVASFLACFIFLVLASAASFSLTDTQGRMHTWKVIGTNGCLSICGPRSARPVWLKCRDLKLQTSSKASNDLVVHRLVMDGQSARTAMHFAEKLNVSYPIIAGNAEKAHPFRPSCEQTFGNPLPQR